MTNAVKTKPYVKKVMRVIDHTMLKPFATEAEIKALIDEAHALGTYAVCINPLHAEFAKSYINANRYTQKLVLVLDFPFGAGTTEARVALAKVYSKIADEIDFVAAIGKVKSGKWNDVQNDIIAVVNAVHSAGKIVKVIVEDAYTTKAEKEKLYEIVCRSGADFIKTGTGFEDKSYADSIGNKVGAQPENIALMASVAAHINPNIGIKAAGGIHTIGQVKLLQEASGRELDPMKFRIGASGTRQIYNSISEK